MADGAGGDGAGDGAAVGGGDPRWYEVRAIAEVETPGRARWGDFVLGVLSVGLLAAYFVWRSPCLMAPVPILLFADAIRRLSDERRLEVGGRRLPHRDLGLLFEQGFRDGRLMGVVGFVDAGEGVIWVSGAELQRVRRWQGEWVGRRVRSEGGGS